jgi:hypothetical protein
MESALILLFRRKREESLFSSFSSSTVNSQLGFYEFTSFDRCSFYIVLLSHIYVYIAETTYFRLATSTSKLGYIKNCIESASEYVNPIAFSVC